MDRSFQQAIDAINSGTMSLNCPLITQWTTDQDMRTAATVVGRLLDKKEKQAASPLLPPSSLMPLLP